MNQKVKEHLLRSKEAAAREAAAINRRCGLSRDFLYIHLKKYIFHRFMLDDTDTDSDLLEELSQISIAKKLKLDKSLIKEIDRSSGCAGAPSAIIKKVLLLLAIQRDLKIRFTEYQTENIQTIGELTAIILEIKQTGHR